MRMNKISKGLGVEEGSETRSRLDTKVRWSQEIGAHSSRESAAWQAGDPLRIETRRTTMCSMSQSDITDRVVGWFNDPQVMADVLMQSNWSKESLQDHVLDQDNERKFMLCIFATDSDEPIGWAEIHAKKGGVGTRDLVIADRRFLGREFEFEALSAIDRFMFENLKLHKYVAPALAKTKLCDWQTKNWDTFLRRCVEIMSGVTINGTTFTTTECSLGSEGEKDEFRSRID
jgi:RimJ/RimL family protein N-acetyltransferase